MMPFCGLQTECERFAQVLIRLFRRRIRIQTVSMSTQASVQNSAQEFDHFINSDQPLSPDAIGPHPMLDDGDECADNNATAELISEITLQQKFIAAFGGLKIETKALVNDEHNISLVAPESQVLKAKIQKQPPDADIDAESDLHRTCQNADVVGTLINGCLTIPAEVHCSHIFAMEDRRGTLKSFSF